MIHALYILLILLISGLSYKVGRSNGYLECMEDYRIDEKMDD